MAAEGALWKVVGGAAKGGIVVRSSKETSSQEESERLATGAVVRGLEHDAAAQRLLYEKVAGKGPKTGWVSTVFQGRQLLVKSDEEASKADEEQDPTVLAMQLYCQRFGQAEEQEDARFGLNRKAFGWQQIGLGMLGPEEHIRAALEHDLRLPKQAAPARDKLVLDSRHTLCSHCCLPLGELGYTSNDGKKTWMHGECLAQIMVRDLKEKEEAAEKKEAEAKQKRRDEFDIGWKAEHIPRNVAIAPQLKACSVSQGMCCLVLQDSGAVAVAPTVEPAAAVNLEYLAIALQVRFRDNREPLFSLDPVDASSPKDSTQVKRFEPAWLAGTSVGEVLFQSDYHLKELSMGEYEQPVLGMKSCHDFSDGDESQKWSAREWFVVRKAEVQMTGDNVLLPLVKMGVEAREQIQGEHGLEDVRTTRQNHPLVKYADSFTHNFDLIAERKSVVYHLRELAKASVLAKFLVEAELGVDESWLRAGGETKEACCLEIPQLWNERTHSQIRVQDGKIVDRGEGCGTSMHRLYGGVQFGLDKFQLSGSRQPARMMSAGLAARQFVQPARHLGATLSAGLATRQFQRSFGPMGVQPSRVSAGVGLDKFALAGGARQPSRMMSAGLAARQFVQPARHLSATLSAGLATRQFQRSFGPMGVQPSRVSAGLARGVDLNLDEFNLSAATRVEASAKIAEGVDITPAFWANLADKSSSMFNKDDRTLLNRVFDPSLSDRRDEGDRFTPPDTSFAYVQGLRVLIQEEEAVREQRRQAFCALAFDMEAPGAAFPSSWRSSVELARREASTQARRPQPRPDYKALAGALASALAEAVPVFDKSTEDGTRFRVYRLGSLEVRTTQELGGEESVGAVFSEALAGAPQRQLTPQEKVVKVTEYVEGSCQEPHCYMVLETELRNFIVVEQMKHGVLKHDVNPKDLEDRNSLAKVFRAKAARAGVTAAAAMQLQGDVYGSLVARS